MQRGRTVIYLQARLGYEWARGRQAGTATHGPSPGRGCLKRQTRPQPRHKPEASKFDGEQRARHHPTAPP